MIAKNDAMRVMPAATKCQVYFFNSSSEVSIFSVSEVSFSTFGGRETSKYANGRRPTTKAPAAHQIAPNSCIESACSPFLNNSRSTIDRSPHSDMLAMNVKSTATRIALLKTSVVF